MTRTIHRLKERLATAEDLTPDILGKASVFVRRGWNERLQTKGLPPDDTSLGFFKRSAYVVITTFMEAPNGEEIIQQGVVDCNRVPKKGPTYDENPFHWGLLAMFSEHSIINKDQRRLFANQLLYAHRHYVPEHYLIGFIYQLGRSDRIYAKVKEKNQEPWFDYDD
jgi:hypothetical protein